MANANRKPGSPEIPFQNFMYIDPETRRILKDKRMVSMFKQKARQDG